MLQTTYVKPPATFGCGRGSIPHPPLRLLQSNGGLGSLRKNNLGIPRHSFGLGGILLRSRPSQPISFSSRKSSPGIQRLASTGSSSQRWWRCSQSSGGDSPRRNSPGTPSRSPGPHDLQYSRSSPGGRSFRSRKSNPGTRARSSGSASVLSISSRAGGRSRATSYRSA